MFCSFASRVPNFSIIIVPNRPEALGIVPGGVFLVCLILCLVGYATINDQENDYTDNNNILHYGAKSLFIHQYEEPNVVKRKLSRLSNTFFSHNPVVSRSKYNKHSGKRPSRGKRNGYC